MLGIDLSNIDFTNDSLVIVSLIATLFAGIFALTRQDQRAWAGLVGFVCGLAGIILVVVAQNAYSAYMYGGFDGTGTAMTSRGHYVTMLWCVAAFAGAMIANSVLIVIVRKDDKLSVGVSLLIVAVGIQLLNYANLRLSAFTSIESLIIQTSYVLLVLSVAFAVVGTSYVTTWAITRLREMRRSFEI